MSYSLLDEALQKYKEAISDLEQSLDSLSIENILKVLKARDVLQGHLDREDRSLWDGDRVLVELDDRLKEKAGAIVKVFKLGKWRQSLQIDSKKAWWWELETEVPPHPWDRFDWLWKMGGVLGWTANMGLLLDIIPRFLMGGTGLVGAIAVMFPSLIALLQASNEFTQSGQESFDKLLARLKIPKHFHEEAKFVSLALFCLFLVIFRANLPALSEWYTKQGTQRYREGQLATAEDYYQQALEIDPNNIKANYNLGVIYEDLQEFEKAETQYSIAAKGGLVSAQNNLARLYIVEEQPESAIPLLWQGLSTVDEQLISVHYNLLKNLGWALWLEGRQDLAENMLQGAIALAEEPEGIERIKNRGSAHCLLAQVYQQTEETEEAIAQWQLCCQKGTIFNRDETQWLNLAHTTLQKVGRSCEINS
ncbi:MAG: tetratricopeptide repeat protein [Cyanobacteria bacterium SBLK]|nr:tetratricopeptide repeat protein [Cyanobacteria bacterium SBLK]